MKKRQDALINYSYLIDDAKATATELMASEQTNALDLFYEKDLKKIENGIKNINEFSSKCWLISAITLYSMIYDNCLYQQSGLTWEQYLSESKQRLGLEPRDVTEQLSSARFFIKNHLALKRAGWNPIGSGRKLARAELSLELTGDLDAVIQHLAQDTWVEFKDWYSSYKKPKELTAQKVANYDVEPNRVKFDNGSLLIDGKPAITVSSELEEIDKAKLEYFIRKIAESLNQGYEPAIIPVYDKKEATTLIRLRDKNRQDK